MVETVLNYGAAGAVIFAVVIFIMGLRSRYHYGQMTRRNPDSLESKLLAEIYSMKDLSPVDACDMLYNHHYRVLVDTKRKRRDYSVHLRTTITLLNIKHQLIQEEVETSSAFQKVDIN